MLNLENKKVTIIGAKRSGKALAKLVIRLKGQAKITEQNSKETLSEEFRQGEASQDITFEFNGHTRSFIEDSDFVVLSPGVRFDSRPVRWAKAKGIPVLGEIEFAYQFCSKPVIAVTGSNGKTTVVTILHEVFKRAGYKTCLCGNLGFPFSDYVLNLDDMDYVILETSSFQLESIIAPDDPILMKDYNGFLNMKGFQPYVAVFLNFNQNHLDRHNNLDEYFNAKKRIFINQDIRDFAVLDYGDARIRELSSQIKSRVSTFNSHEAINKKANKNPNNLAVIEVAKIFGINSFVCEEVFQQFKGVEHRLEWVRNIEGIDFVNDSKATTAQAALWALRHIDRPVVMICGGREKNIDYSVLKELVRQKVRRMFVFGESKDKIKQAFAEFIAVEECDVLENAVLRARDSASEGDCVLLSPMCASFDMFSDFEERGRVFKEIVNKLDEKS